MARFQDLRKRSHLESPNVGREVLPTYFHGPESTRASESRTVYSDTEKEKLACSLGNSNFNRTGSNSLLQSLWPRTIK